MMRNLVSVSAVLACCWSAAAQEKAPVRTTTWGTVQIVPPKGEEKFYRIAFLSRYVGYLASNQAIYKTEDGCQTWKPVLRAAFLKEGYIDFLRFQDARNGWLGCSGKLYVTDDGGESWTPVDLDVRAHALALGGNGWVLVGGGKGLAQKRGASAEWETIDFTKDTGVDGQADSVVLIAIAGPQTALVAANGRFAARSRVYRTTDAGKTWQEVFKSDKGRLGGLHFADGKNGWLMGGSSLWVTRDGGSTWKGQLNPEDRELRLMAFDPHGSPVGVAPLYGYGGDRKILFTTNGKDWRAIELEVKKAEFISADVVDSKCAYVLMGDGRFIRFLDAPEP